MLAFLILIFLCTTSYAIKSSGITPPPGSLPCGWTPTQITPLSGHQLANFKKSCTEYLSLDPNDFEGDEQKSLQELQHHLHTISTLIGRQKATHLSPIITTAIINFLATEPKRQGPFSLNMKLNEKIMILSTSLSMLPSQ